MTTTKTTLHDLALKLKESRSQDKAWRVPLSKFIRGVQQAGVIDRSLCPSNIRTEALLDFYGSLSRRINDFNPDQESIDIWLQKLWIQAINRQIDI